MRRVFNRFTATALLVGVIHVGNALAATRPAERPPLSIDRWVVQHIERLITILGDVLTVPKG